MSRGWRPTTTYVALSSSGTPSRGVWVLMTRRCVCAARRGERPPVSDTMRKSSQGESPSSAPGRSAVWKTRRRQIIWTQVVPDLDRVLITMSPAPEREIPPTGAVLVGRGVVEQLCGYGDRVRPSVRSLSHATSIADRCRPFANPRQPHRTRRATTRQWPNRRFRARRSGGRRAGSRALDGGELTIAIATGQLDSDAHGTEPRRPRRRRVLKRILIITGSAFVALFALVAAWIGISLYRIDHAVHHVGRSGLAAGPGQERPAGHRQGPRPQRADLRLPRRRRTHQRPEDPEHARAAPARRRHRPHSRRSACTRRPPSSPGSTASASR